MGKLMPALRRQWRRHGSGSVAGRGVGRSKGQSRAMGVMTGRGGEGGGGDGQTVRRGQPGHGGCGSRFEVSCDGGWKRRLGGPTVEMGPMAWMGSRWRGRSGGGISCQRQRRGWWSEEMPNVGIEPVTTMARVGGGSDGGRATGGGWEWIWVDRDEGDGGGTWGDGEDLKRRHGGGKEMRVAAVMGVQLETRGRGGETRVEANGNGDEAPAGIWPVVEGCWWLGCLRVEVYVEGGVSGSLGKQEDGLIGRLEQRRGSPRKPSQ